jgi:3-hydroxyisobutyryl-CoA hydrolase
MVQAIRATMESFKTDPDVRAILLKGSGGKAFCSGGDVKGVREALVADPNTQVAKDQVYHEYNLLYEMANIGKPTIALFEGVTMGFGLGLACSTVFRIATEKTRLAMPENNIGLFPDVGFAYLAANRMPAGVGRIMALSGVHLLGADDALKSGLASHFVEMAKLPELEAALRSADLSTDANGSISTCIDSVKASSPGDGKLDANGPLIERMKGASSLTEAYAALDPEGEPWTVEVKAAMQKGAPFSQAAIWAVLQAAEAEREVPEPQRISMALERDYALACRLLHRPDFCEGVRAVLVDKGSTAAWQPATIADVSQEEVMTAYSDLPEGERRLGLPVEAK